MASNNNNFNSFCIIPFNNTENHTRKEVLHVTYHKHNKIPRSKSGMIINKHKEKNKDNNNHKNDLLFLVENSKKHKGTVTTFINEKHRKSLQKNLLKSSIFSRNRNNHHIINSSSKELLSKHRPTFVRNVVEQQTTLNYYEKNIEPLINNMDYETYKNHIRQNNKLDENNYKEQTQRTYKTCRNQQNFQSHKITKQSQSVIRSASMIFKEPTKVHNNKAITSLLNQKNISNIPAIIPTYISIGNQYDTMSEKRRHENTMNQFIKLKWRTIQNPSKAFAYIAEFFLLNNITNAESHTNESLHNFNLFLDKDFHFHPKKSIQDIIMEGILYHPPPGHERKKIYEDLYSDEWCHIDNNANNNTPIPTKVIDNKSLYNHNSNNEGEIKSEKDKNKSVANEIDHAKLHRKFGARTQKQDLKGLVHELEGEIGKMNNHHYKRTKKLGQIPHKNYPCSPININKSHNTSDDNNKYVPNLCLSSSAVQVNILRKMEEQKNSDEMKNKKYKKMKEVNKRLYYDSCSKENVFNMDSIKRHSKLTEYIILERSKRALSLEEHTANIRGINDIISFKLNH